MLKSHASQPPSPPSTPTVQVQWVTGKQRPADSAIWSQMCRCCEGPLTLVSRRSRQHCSAVTARRHAMEMPSALKGTTPPWPIFPHSTLKKSVTSTWQEAVSGRLCMAGVVIQYAKSNTDAQDSLSSLKGEFGSTRSAGRLELLSQMFSYIYPESMLSTPHKNN